VPQQEVLDDHVAVPAEQGADGGEEERDGFKHARSIADSERIRTAATVLPSYTSAATASAD
jgi:hypothetical protein